MKAVKANKEYTISEQEKARYVAEGYDIIGDDGKVITYGRGKTVPYEKYKAVVDELEALKAKNEAAEEDADDKEKTSKKK